MKLALVVLMFCVGGGVALEPFAILAAQPVVSIGCVIKEFKRSGGC